MSDDEDGNKTHTIDNFSEPEEPFYDGFKPHKVFINHVDSFNSRYIAAFITDQIYGLAKLTLPGMGEEAGEGEEPPAAKPQLENVPKDRYEFVGTLSTKYRKPTEDISYVIEESDENYAEEILKCGFIVFDITKSANEINKALKALNILTEQLDTIHSVGPKTYESFIETKIFILISPIMTWALTKPLDPDDPDLPLSEVDYRKRRPHPNYREHYNCEKEVIKVGQKYKDKLKTYVLCIAFPYGEEEDTFELFFKMAWYNEVLPIFESGNNRIPFIHVRDLAKALHGVMENAPSRPQYILAAEPNPTTFKQFVKSLSKALGDGKVANIVREEAFLYKNMTQELFERCTINLNVEPVFLVENLQLEFQSEQNISENMNQVVEEFKTKRNLKPVKTVIHGPPGAGKTHMAEKLCNYYNCKYVSIQSMLDDFLQIWKDDLARLQKPKLEEYLGEEVDEMAEEEEEEDPQQILEQIREVQMFMESGIDKIPEDYLIGLLKTYLAKNFCQNRGYVLDGFPMTTEQAKELFGQGATAMGEEEEAEAPQDISKILPDLVVSLVATDEFITQRIMIQPEDAIKDTPYAEETILQRLEAYRELDTDENTVLNYFDELEIDILLLECKDDQEGEFSLIVHKLGPACTFGLTPEEEEELMRLEEQERQLLEEKEQLNKRMLEEKADEERKNRMEYWTETLEKLQMEEEKILVAQSEPLRHYLMKYVFPTLTKGLIEVATIKPDDPVDFLAEYLFRENPEGKMFDPSYTIEGENLYGEFKGYIEKLIMEHEAFD